LALYWEGVYWNTTTGAEQPGHMHHGSTEEIGTEADGRRPKDRTGRIGQQEATPIHMVDPGQDGSERAQDGGRLMEMRQLR
jgi:hypothetical protein